MGHDGDLWIFIGFYDYEDGYVSKMNRRIWRVRIIIEDRCGFGKNS